MPLSHMPRLLRISAAAWLLPLAVSLGPCRAALVTPPPDSRPAFHLLAGDFVPNAAGSQPDLSFLAPGEQTALIQFQGPVMPGWKTQVESTGVQLLRYLPDYAWVVRGSGAALRATAQLPCVRWMGPMRKEYRLDPALPVSGDSVDAVAMMEPFADEAKLRQAALARGLTVEKAGPRLLRLSGPATAVRSLADEDTVEWITPAATPRPLNDRSRALIGVTDAWTSLGLYGDGQLIGIVDSGLDTGNNSTLSPDFQGRVASVFIRAPGGDWADQFGHGTHIAGILVGQGRTPAALPDPTSYAGVAPRAKLVVQALELVNGSYKGIPDDLNELFAQAYDAGARLHNDSWGDSQSAYGSYSLHASQIDAFMWTHPDFLAVFAAGNDGTDSPSLGRTPNDTDNLPSRDPGTGRVRGGSLYAPGTAKNALTVGASEGLRPPRQGWGGYSNSDWNSWAFTAPPITNDPISDNPSGLAAFSSRGPTVDGRIKPDLVAPGTNIISTLSSKASAGRLWGPASPGYAYDGGTSFSAPFVTAAAALTRQWLQARGVANPGAALIKAILMNGARDLSPGQYGSGPSQEIYPRPNGDEGWGRLDVITALSPPEPLSVRYLEDAGLKTNETRTWFLRAGAAQLPLKVMLCWTDPPAAPEASVALVDDLDLTVRAPDGQVFTGNGTVDRRNPVEGVQVASAAVGVWRVTVRGYNVPANVQPFALTALGAVGDFLLAGDTNGDGHVTVADAVLALQRIVGARTLTEDQQVAADVVTEGESAGRLDILDVIALLRRAVGL